MHPTFDTRDQEIVAERVDRYNTHEGPRVGDFVDFADGITRRISETWDGWVQTSDSGSFYLGDEGCSFSGSLYLAVPVESLTLTEEVRPGDVWIFHHDRRAAHNGVATTIGFRVYTCSQPAPEI